MEEISKAKEVMRTSTQAFAQDGETGLDDKGV